MAAARSEDELFDDILQCFICKSLIVDPRALPCLHNYCYACISKWSIGKEPGDQTTCPFCEKTFTIPDGGITNLQKNFFVEHLLDLVKLKSVEAKPKFCEICVGMVEERNVDKLAMVFCLECHQRMCQSCCNGHSKMKTSVSHSFISMNELSTSVGVYLSYQSTVCDKHPEKKIEIFCFECKLTVCIMCYITDHNSHKCSDVAGIASDFRISLGQDIKHLKMALEASHANLIKVQHEGVNFSARTKMVETEITTRAVELHAKIENDKQKLIADLNATHANHQREITNVTEGITKSKSILRNTLNYCSELLQKGSMVDVARQAPCLHTQVEDLVKVQTVDEALRNVSAVDISFSSAVLTRNEPSLIGSLKRHCVADVGPTLRTALPRDNHQEPTTASPGISSKVQPVLAMAVLKDELFVSHGDGTTLMIHHRSSLDPSPGQGSGTIIEVSVYDAISLKPKRAIPIPDMLSTPTGLATCQANNCLYVSDFNNVCVHRVDLATNAQERWNVAKYPVGLSVMGSNGNVLVAFGSSGGVGEYSPLGVLVHILQPDVRIFYATELNDTIACIENGWVQRIFTMSKKGQILRKFELKSEAWQTTRNYPRCLAVDSTGNIIFPGQCANNIKLINDSLTRVRKVHIPNGSSLRSLYALCYDENKGKLYVGENFSGCNYHFTESGEKRARRTSGECHLLVLDV